MHAPVRLIEQSRVCLAPRPAAFSRTLLERRMEISPRTSRTIVVRSRQPYTPQQCRPPADLHALVRMEKADEVVL